MDYIQFWEKLSNFYPVSHGELRLAIANKHLEIDTIDMDAFIQEMHLVLEDLMRKMTSPEKTKVICIENNHANLVPLLSNNFTGIIRLDCMYSTKWELKVIEINADYPDWLLMHDNTYNVIENSNEDIYPNKTLFLELFPDSEKTIFVAYPKDAFFKDAYFTEYNTLIAAGMNAYIWNMEDLSKQWNELFYKGIKISTIKRCIETWKMTQENVELLQNTDVEVINSFDLRTLWFKDLFNQIDNSHFPKTFTLNSDNINQIIEQKNSWIIKPTNLFEWQWVYIGKDIPEDEWKNLLIKNAWNNYIAQEFIEAEKIDMEFYEDGKIVEKNVYFDICPHFFIKNGNIIGNGIILTRYSENKILNIAQGWWLGYYKI